MSIPRPEHPRPDFERSEWLNLNGVWDFAFDPEQQWKEPNDAKFDQRIVVPFPWESKLSGVHRPDYRGVAWYRRTFTIPTEWKGKRVALKFGAVDWHAKVWANGELLGEHEDGYVPFEFDVTKYAGQEVTLVVRVFDVVDRETPTGKQTGWYTPTSGIWQTVYLEATGATFIKYLKFTTPDLSGAVNVDLTLQGEGQKEIVVESPDGQFPTSKHTTSEQSSRFSPKLRFGFHVSRPKLWSPDSPALYPAVIRVRQNGKDVDVVKTYFGIRTIARGKFNGSDFEYVLLNGKPIYLRGVLDQSFNPDGIYTAPDDEFMENDIKLAKQAGFNMIRIHIKVEEPRRLYFADKFGILLMCDMPNMNAHTPRARQTWERTMREQIARDFSHPSIFCWCIFNEEWGIGRLDNAPREHRVDWVEKMFHLTKELDPTRLCLDNTGWSHLITDLNSFHWYSRDVDGFRRHYREINDGRIKADDNWNYIADRKQRGEPFINNEFGYVSAGDGDSDMTWGNLFAVNAMRACERMVGYTYTELTDIEWEHNGVYNYNRSSKEMGFDFWAPGMTIRDVFADDFLVLDAPAIKHAKPGETVSVPVKFSHFSGKYESGLKLKWQLRLLDRFSRWNESKMESRPCPKTPAYRLTSLGDIALTLPNDAPVLATLVAYLEDAQGNRVHTNFTQWLICGETGAPRAELVDANTIALRFRPDDWSESQFSELDMPNNLMEGKHYGRGQGFVTYRLKLPEGLPLESLQSIAVTCEVAAKAGREKVDWAERVNPQDYPQTDGKKFPTTVDVDINGVKVATWVLPDDPADARGVLSHWRGVERGSYGFLQVADASSASLAVAVSNRLRVVGAKQFASPLLIVRFTVPASATHRGGLAIYGENMGYAPLDPTVTLKFSKPLPMQPDWTSNEPVAVETFRERLTTALPSAQRGGTEWRFTTDAPPANWTQPDFDDSGWKTGKSGFGRPDTPGAIVGTQWTTGDVYIRKKVSMSKLSSRDPVWLEVHHDEDCEIYVNGKLLWREGRYLTQYKTLRLTPEQVALFREGENTIAVHCRQTAGGQFADVGITTLRQ